VAEPQVDAAPISGIDWEQYLARLPEMQRAVITLFYFEERNLKEVAALLDLPEGTVKSHLHRARRALGDMLE
jgi:RNA polymerase sigma-70 factor (ECF subfamily)